MRAWLVILALGFGVATLCHAAPINRCEFTDGRVIYSDEPCPAGAQHARTVDEKPAVEVMKAEQAQNAKSSGTVSERAQDAKSSGTVRRSTETADDSKDPEVASELRKMKLAECDDLVHRIEYAQHDLNAAAATERASAELSLRRLQAEHESKCASRAAK